MRLPIWLWSIFFVIPVTMMSGQHMVADTFYSDDIAIRFIDKGEGAPVVLMHGLTGRLEEWGMSGIMSGLLDEGFRVIAFDCRGHGGSEKLYEPERYFGEEVRDVLRLMDHLGIDRTHIAGYSRGAEIASQVVMNHPERVLTAVFGGWVPENPVATLPKRQCHEVADSLSKGAFPTPLLDALMTGEKMPPEQQAMMMEQIQATNDMKAIAAAFRAGCTQEAVSTDFNRTSGVPVLLILGSDDGMASGIDTDQLMKEGLDISMVAGADHFSARAHPDFLSTMVKFLRREMD